MKKDKKERLKIRNLDMHKGLRLDRRSAGPMSDSRKKRIDKKKELQRALEEE